MKHTTKAAGVFLLVIALAGSASAAGVLITSSKQIKNGTIRRADLSPGVRTMLAKPGPVGPAGANGQPGAKGEPGAQGLPGPGSSAKGVSVPAGVSDVALKPGDEYATIAVLDVKADQAGILLFSGTVEAATTSQNTATVELRIVHNGHAHDLPADTSIAVGGRQALVVSFQCDLLPGAQHIDLQARSSGGEATISGRSFDAVSATQGQ